MELETLPKQKNTNKGYYASNFYTKSDLIIFAYRLEEDEFISTRPSIYKTQKGFLVIPGMTKSGIHPATVNQFMFCQKTKLAFMLAEKASETHWRAFFLHRVLRMKKRLKEA